MHEGIGHAHRIVGVLEEDGAVGFGVRRAAVIAGRHQGVRLGLFFGLALDELEDIRVIDVQNHHLGGAARLAARFDDAGKSIKALHEAQRTRCRSAAAQTLIR